MPRSEQAVFTNMCMIYDDDGTILVQDRLNPDFPGITFPGGHVEYRETLVDSVIREVKEETGLDIENPVLCGVKHFYTTDDMRYVVFFYKTNRFSGTLKDSEEGKVFWIKRSELSNYVLAEYMEEMLQVFESDTLSELFFYNDDGLKFKLL